MDMKADVPLWSISTGYDCLHFLKAAAYYLCCFETQLCDYSIDVMYEDDMRYHLLSKKTIYT